MRIKFVALGIIAAGIAGCAPVPSEYETEPVLVKTSKGIVTCQLYKDDVVIWDEAVNFPRTMSLQEADAICQDEGFRVKREGRRPTDPDGTVPAL